MPRATSSPTTRSTSLGPASHAGVPSRSRNRSSTPAPFSIVTGLNPRADHEATKASTHEAWNESASRVLAATAAEPEITRSPGAISCTPSSCHTIEGGA